MNKYLIALSVGGIMEMPDITYQDFQIIEAITLDDAVTKYNKINNCSYFYGTCLAEKVDGEINILNKQVSYEDIERLNDKNLNNIITNLAKSLNGDDVNIDDCIYIGKKKYNQEIK
jgi:hypothetical protein